MSVALEQPHNIEVGFGFLVHFIGPRGSGLAGKGEGGGRSRGWVPRRVGGVRLALLLLLVALWMRLLVEGRPRRRFVAAVQSASAWMAESAWTRT